MSIIQKDKIDFIGTDEDTGNVILTITDHLDWEDELYHLKTLQDKLNGYIEFIESGQIKVDFPDIVHAKGHLIIEIVSKYDYPKIAMEFIEKVRPVLRSIGAGIAQSSFNGRSKQ